MSEVRGRSQEDPTPEGQRPRGATPRPRSGLVAERSYPVSEVSGGREETSRVRGQVGGQEELHHVQGQWRPGGDTPRPRSGRPGEATSCPRPGALTLRSHPEPEARAGDGGRNIISQNSSLSSVL